jgi:hypothetical protein
MEPFKIRVSVELSGSYTITEEDLEEVRWLAHQANRGGLPLADPFQDEELLTKLINEMVESKLDFYMMDYDDFDWRGVTLEELINAVRGLDANGEPLIRPEIPGQITLDDVLTELV